MSRLTLEERETIINFNEADSIASIYTCSEKWMKHCEEVLGLKASEVRMDGRKVESKDYEFPKGWIRLPRKTRKINLSKEELEKRVSRLPRK